MISGPPSITPEVAEFMQRLDAAWQLAGFPRVTLTSWWRSRYQNAVVGGAATSQHLTGLAVDVVPDLGGDKLAAWARQLGLVPVDEGDHWHIQRFPAGGARGLCCGAAVSQVR